MPDLPSTGPESPLATLPMQAGYWLFYGGLALGAALTLYGSVVNDPAGRARRLRSQGLLLFALLATVFLQVRVDTQRGFLAEEEQRFDEKVKRVAAKQGQDAALKMQYMYMPSGNSLNLMTLNDPALAADYVWLTSLQFVSNSFRRGDKFEMLSRFYKTMIDLDPQWISVEINGGKVLSALIEDREKAEECYVYAMKKNPGQWRLFNEAGMLFVMPPRDPRRMKEYSHKAADWFELALKQPNVPDKEKLGLNDRIARLRLETGGEYYKQAEELLFKNATDPDSPAGLKDISRRDWLKAHSMAQAAALTDVAQALKKQRGTFPATVRDLIVRMAKPDLFARDAYGFPFDYDPASGEVTSHGAKALRAVQAGHIVDQLIELYKSSKKRLPHDLAEVRDFVRSIHEAPFEPESALLIEAIGIEKDPTTGPLGPWNYDAHKGAIVLPPECNAQALYGHVKEFFPAS